MGQPPDVLLGQAALPQGGAYLQLRQGPHSRPVPRVVGGVGAVYQEGKAVRPGRRPDGGQDGPLAVVAAVWGVGGDRGEGEQVQGQHRQLRAQLPGQAAGVLRLEPGLEGGGDAVGPHLPGVPLGGAKEVGRVRSAGEGQGRPGMFPEKFL